MNPYLLNIIQNTYAEREKNLSELSTKPNAHHSPPKEQKSREYLIFQDNFPRFKYPTVVETYTGYILSMTYIRNGAIRSGITPAEIDIIKKHASFISPLSKFRSIQDAYFANLYSIPIQFESLEKINIKLILLLNNISYENYNIERTLGRDRLSKIAYSWLLKKHPETHKEFIRYFGEPPFGHEREFTIGLIHYCLSAHKTMYESSIVIAKKIYNFRVNSLKKKIRTDGSITKKLQAEVYQETIFQINFFSKKHQISTAEAIQRLIKEGYTHLINTPAGQLAPSAPITYPSNLDTLIRFP